MASQRIDDLTAFDWDDTALIQAYNKGMTLRVRDFVKDLVKEKQNPRKKPWKAGDYCRAVYPEDNLYYEAKIIEISDNTCTVEFLGYHEEAEVDLGTLSKTKGHQARKKQVKAAKEYYPAENAEESASGDDTKNEVSEMETPHSRKRDFPHSHHGNHLVDNTADYTAAETTFHQTIYPAHGSGMQPVVPMMPPVPSMLHTPDLPQNSSMSAMLSSWYMAGYYTGLHQGQKKRCCCHSSSNCFNCH